MRSNKTPPMIAAAALRTLTCLFLLSLWSCFTQHTDPAVLTNSIGIQLILIPGGNFMMGSPSTEEGRFDSEGPVHEVYLDPFYIGQTEVTVGQWRTFIEETAHNWDKWSLLTDYAPGDDYPIVFINWSDAEAFCRWLSAREGKIYRLPTEAEWEKAARGGLEGKKYPWGDEPPDGSQCNFADKHTDLPWSDRSAHDGYPYTAPVGSFPANGYRLYDMAGNVWEWCQDWFDWDYYKNSPAANPRGASSGIDRSIRGGSWSNDANIIRCAFRGFLLPVVPSHPRGFRIVMEP
jgi:formylglycine-generating enzyme required for sulfatase activity